MAIHAFCTLNEIKNWFLWWFYRQQSIAKMKFVLVRSCDFDVFQSWCGPWSSSMQLWFCAQIYFGHLEVNQLVSSSFIYFSIYSEPFLIGCLIFFFNFLKGFTKWLSFLRIFVCGNPCIVHQTFEYITIIWTFDTIYLQLLLVFKFWLGSKQIQNIHTCKQKLPWAHL